MKKRDQPILFLSVLASSLLVYKYLTRGERRDILLDNQSSKVVEVVVFVYDRPKIFTVLRYKSEEYEIMEGDSLIETVTGVPYSAGLIDYEGNLTILTDVRTRYDYNGGTIYAYIENSSDPISDLRPIAAVRMED